MARRAPLLLSALLLAGTAEARVFKGTISGATGPVFVGRFAFGVDASNRAWRMGRAPLRTPSAGAV